MNIQELQTIIGYKLPIKIFVFDNKGYGMIKQTQSDWPKFLKKGVACEPVMVDLKALAKSLDVVYDEIKNEKDFKKLKLILGWPLPTICRVIIPDGTKIEPKLKFGDELTDLTPKITKNEKKKIQNILKG